MLATCAAVTLPLAKRQDKTTTSNGAAMSTDQARKPLLDAQRSDFLKAGTASPPCDATGLTG